MNCLTNPEQHLIDEWNRACKTFVAMQETVYSRISYGQAAKVSISAYGGGRQLAAYSLVLKYHGDSEPAVFMGEQLIFQPHTSMLEIDGVGEAIGMMWRMLDELKNRVRLLGMPVVERQRSIDQTMRETEALAKAIAERIKPGSMTRTQGNLFTRVVVQFVLSPDEAVTIRKGESRTAKRLHILGIMRFDPETMQIEMREKLMERVLQEMQS